MTWVYYHCFLEKNSLFFPFSLNIIIILDNISYDSKSGNDVYYTPTSC